MVVWYGLVTPAIAAHVPLWQLDRGCNHHITSLVRRQESCQIIVMQDLFEGRLMGPELIVDHHLSLVCCRRWGPRVLQPIKQTHQSVGGGQEMQGSDWIAWREDTTRTPAKLGSVIMNDHRWRPAENAIA